MWNCPGANGSEPPGGSSSSVQVSLVSWRFDTKAIHCGQSNDDSTGAVTTPIYQTSTFGQSEPGVNNGYCYARTGNPTRTALEENLAALENARYGLAFASGMSAIHAVLATLSSGDHVIATQNLYGGAWRIFTKVFARFGIEFSFVDTTSPAAVEGSGMRVRITATALSDKPTPGRSGAVRHAGPAPDDADRRRDVRSSPAADSTLSPGRVGIAHSTNVPGSGKALS